MEFPEREVRGEDMQEKEITVSAYSKNTLGILDNNEKWWNIGTTTASVDNKVKELRKGDKIKLVIDEEGNYTDIEIIEKAKREYPGKPQRDDYIGFDEILVKAHNKFKNRLSITTHLEPLMKLKPEEKTSACSIDGWIAKATVTIKENESEQHRTFTAYGDATSKNVSEYIKDSLPRMAETRAIARALRFALGERLVVEELADPKQSKQDMGLEKAVKEAKK